MTFGKLKHQIRTSKDVMMFLENEKDTVREFSYLLRFRGDSSSFPNVLVFCGSGLPLYEIFSFSIIDFVFTLLT